VTFFNLNKKQPNSEKCLFVVLGFFSTTSGFLHVSSLHTT
jgi:hypothetical protein